MTPAEIEAAYEDQFRHRRFGYGLEIAENGQATIEQKFALRSTVKEKAPFGSSVDRVLWNLARAVKYRKHYVSIVLDDLSGMGANGFAGSYTVVLNNQRQGSQMLYTFWHELGHVIDHRLFKDKHKTHWQTYGSNVAAGAWRQPDNYATTPNEQWARAFSRWVLDGGEPVVTAVLELDGWTD